MLLANVFSKTVLDRWRGMVVAVVSLGVLLIFGMSVYRDLDPSILDSFPEAMRTLVGIPADADVAALAYGAIYNSYGALAMGGVAIAMGSAFIAGEERRGTIGVLLSNPRSRTQVLLAKSAVMLLLVGLGGVVLWGFGEVAPILLDVDITGMHVGAFTLHLTMLTLFFGFFALAVGSWTGRTGPAAGAAAGLMVVSFFAVGLLPMVQGGEDLARAFPWYYLSGSEPLLNGVHWAHVGALGAATVVLSALSVVGVNRRDLRSRSTGVTLVDRLRANPLSSTLADKLAGSTRVSQIWVKTASDHQALLLVVSAGMLLLGAMLGPIYLSLEGVLLDYDNALPESMLAFFGGGDLSTPEGYYQVEVLGLLAPIAVLLVVVTLGAKALAGEEASRTIGLLLANPVSRSRVVSEKALTMVLYGIVVGTATFAGITAGNVISGLGMDNGAIAATAVLLTLLGLLFGSLSLLLSAATGRTSIAVFVPVGLALTMHVLNAMAEINDSPWAWISPFHYYLGTDPMVNGMNWGDAGVLAGVAALLVLLSYPLFNGRDLRQN